MENKTLNVSFPLSNRGRNELRKDLKPGKETQRIKSPHLLETRAGEMQTENLLVNRQNPELLAHNI